VIAGLRSRPLDAPPHKPTNSLSAINVHKRHAGVAKVQPGPYFCVARCSSEMPGVRSQFDWKLSFVPV